MPIPDDLAALLKGNNVWVDMFMRVISWSFIGTIACIGVLK
ncbi:hypothetical protein NOR53_2794 [gamma proteobacterium NOR5-3]|nr:hypothetical protein NOR53_2794 [gamma proteobacterium NOR5-3]